MRFSAIPLTPFIVATSFAAGLNTYATVATLGLLAHLGGVALPHGLALLANGYVIAAAVALFVIEFFADKIPVFDLVWNALHTFIRPPLAALLAYGAASQLAPGSQLLSAALGGAVALAAHGGKTAVRAAVTPSPEPLSNFALSTSEDAFAIFLSWLATAHPYAAVTLALLSLLAIFAAFRFVIRALRHPRSLPDSALL